MKATPVKGTRDYLPKEVMIRDHLQEIIRETYQEAGFERITTPIIEDVKTRQKVILCLRSRSPYRTDACRYGAAL